MKIYFQPEADLVQFASTLSELNADAEVGSILVFACDENGWLPADLDPLLQGSAKPVFGGIFPQIIHGLQNFTQGAVCVGLQGEPAWGLVGQLSDEGANYDQPLTALADAWDALSGPATLLVLVDGLAGRIASLTESLFFSFGLDNNFIGGGAGSLSFQQRPCLLTPQGLVADAALVVRLPVYSGVGVNHGWQPITEPLKVTSSLKNQVKCLDWKPAFEAYRQVVENHSGVQFTENNFFDIAKSYPLGINKLDTEMIVRDPLMLNEQGDMVCVGEVPEGCFVRILNGSPESLVSAAADARARAEKVFPHTDRRAPEVALFIDCISRVLFLEDGIEKEFASVTTELPLFGAFTLGEIANSGQDYLEFYNKTAVVGLLAEPPADEVAP
ncbi:FIST signal transduction protein [Nitrincola tapanii]|uniref:Histidine kinase n=1 Tax=Nitrincola tapanii TaxID=1708751 RepID=A0A5A9W066_9GAMM|nr:FIST C-terminal domain-containing protein [Nitrincola tapanii]KAA0874137.1 histidine kinase [Nitrincola tapanii]